MPVFWQKGQIMDCALAVKPYYGINVQNKGQPGSRYIYMNISFKTICVFTNALVPRLSFLGVHYIVLQVKMYIFAY